MEYDEINIYYVLKNSGSAVDSEVKTYLSLLLEEYVKGNSLSNTYNQNKSVRFKTPMLRSNLCDYADAYILVKRTITVTANAGANNIRDKKR